MKIVHTPYFKNRAYSFNIILLIILFLLYKILTRFCGWPEKIKTTLEPKHIICCLYYRSKHFIKSQAAKGQKATHIMDVTPSFVEHCMQQHHALRLIHGHTHRQNTHQHPTGTRIVLGDWGEKWSVLSVRENGTYEFLQAK